MDMPGVLGKENGVPKGAPFRLSAWRRPEQSQGDRGIMTTAPPRATTGSLWLIFVIAFLTLMGGTIVMPVLPFIVRKYLHDPAAVGVWIGVLASSFSFCALISAPALGRLSDRVGRKRVQELFRVIGVDPVFLLSTAPIAIAL
jgi:MFS family permease